MRNVNCVSQRKTMRSIWPTMVVSGIFRWMRQSALMLPLFVLSYFYDKLNRTSHKFATLWHRKKPTHIHTFSFFLYTLHLYSSGTYIICHHQTNKAQFILCSSRLSRTNSFVFCILCSFSFFYWHKNGFLTIKTESSSPINYNNIQSP